VLLRVVHEKAVSRTRDCGRCGKGWPSLTADNRSPFEDKMQGQRVMWKDMSKPVSLEEHAGAPIAPTPRPDLPTDASENVTVAGERLPGEGDDWGCGHTSQIRLALVVWRAPALGLTQALKFIAEENSNTHWMVDRQSICAMPRKAICASKGACMSLKRIMQV
jgi:hypothetical protein